MQFNTPWGVADDQNASYFCGLQEGLAIGAITGGVNGGDGSGGGDLAIDVAGVVATFNATLVDSETYETHYPIFAGSEAGITPSDHLAFYDNLFKGKDINYELGTFNVSYDSTSYTLHGIKINFKSGITTYIGYRLYYDDPKWGKQAYEQGLIWTGGSRIAAFDASGNFMGGNGDGYENYNAINDTGTIRSGSEYIAKMKVRYVPGYLEVHGDPTWKDSGTSLYILDAPSISGIGFLGSMVLYNAEGTNMSKPNSIDNPSNSTKVASATSSATDMHYNLNVVVNPETFQYCNFFNIYKTYSNNILIPSTLVPLVSLSNRSSLFTLVDINASKAYSCYKLLNNAFSVLAETEMPEIPIDE